MLIKGLLARLALAAATVALAAAATAGAAPHTTADRTIFDCDGDNLLEPAPGERHMPFHEAEESDTDECEDDGTRPFRLPNTHSVLNFIQLSDFQMVDEESPGRVEFLDHTQRNPFLQPFASAYRPHESMTTQITEAMARQVREATSPVTGERPDLTILTGDNADSQQYNETRWFIDILDGTTGPVNPAPENTSDPDDPARDRKVDPNSGIPGDDPNNPDPAVTCPGNPDSVYDGVRDRGNPGFDAQPGYWEPDSSAPGDGEDGDGYSPDREKNFAETPGRDVTVRDWPGLFEAVNSPFEATGLDMPWYSAVGNHDVLVQGNSPDAYFGPLGPSGEFSNAAYQAFVTGCLKPSNLPPALVLRDEQGNPILDSGGKPTFDQARLREFLQAFLSDPGGFIRRCTAIDPEENPEGRAQCETSPVTVPPDPRRCYLAKDDNGDVGLPPPGFTTLAPPPCNTGSWIAQHFRSTGSPPGHGFAPTAASDCERYPDDVEAECREGVPEDGAQVELGRPPQAVENHDGYYSFIPRAGLRFVVLDTITDECGSIFCSEGSVDDQQFDWLESQLETAAGLGQYVMVFSHHTLRTTRFISDDATEEPMHYGQHVDPENPANPQNPSGERTLSDLYCEYPNVLAHIAGHEHENYVMEYDCRRGDAGGSPPGPGYFWHVSTAAHIDWPQQARMVELVTGDRKKLSMVLTMLDHAGPANPGGAPPDLTAQGQSGQQVVRLAGIGREVGYNDYQGSRGARGEREDRNVIVPLQRPFPCPTRTDAPACLPPQP